MKTIAIFGRRHDPHIVAMKKAFERRQAKCVIVDFQGFPKHNLASMGNATAFDDIGAVQPVLFDQVDLIYLRHTNYNDLAPDLVPQGISAEDIREHYHQQITKLSFQASLVSALNRRVPVINPPRGTLYHRQKGLQHHLLLRQKIPTPRALITNNLEEARDFVDSLDGRVVVKPQASGAEVVMADAAFFKKYGEAAKRRPYMFQQYVKGRSFRVYVLGGEAFSMGEILHDSAVVDWRERVQKVSPCNPDAQTTSNIRRAARLLDLPYCAMDLEYDAHTQRMYFLDFNPGALFVNWGQRLGIDMAGGIADYLITVMFSGGNPWISSRTRHNLEPQEPAWEKNKK